MCLGSGTAAGRAFAFFKVRGCVCVAVDAAPSRHRLGRAVAAALHGFDAIAVELNDRHGAEVTLPASCAAVAAAHAHGALGLAAVAHRYERIAPPCWAGL